MSDLLIKDRIPIRAPNVRRERERGYSTSTPIITRDDDGEGELDKIAADRQARKDLELTLKVSEWINAKYGGHPWLVKVSTYHRVVMISIPVFMGQHWKYVIPFHRLSEQAVYEACGNMLERYKIRRGAFSETDFLNAIEHIPRAFRGRGGLVPQ